jgi:polyhydroxybutyrate depolymerase
MVIIGTLLAMGFSLVSGTKKGVDEVMTIEHDGRTRQTIIHLPPEIKDEKLPVVLVFHGLFGNGNYTKKDIISPPYLRNNGSLLTKEGCHFQSYPCANRPFESVFLSWKSGFCCDMLWRTKLMMFHTYTSLCRNIINSLSRDETRVYLVGLSNGGMIVYRLMSRIPELFAACAIVSSSPAGGTDENAIVMIDPPDRGVPPDSVPWDERPNNTL